MDRPPSYNSTLNKDYTPADIPPGWKPKYGNYQSTATIPINRRIELQSSDEYFKLENQIEFGEVPLMMQCPHCHCQITTRIIREPSIGAHLTALLCLISGCCFGCFLLPFCMESFQINNHYCSNCMIKLGQHRG